MLRFKDSTVHGGFGEPKREAPERNETCISGVGLCNLSLKAYLNIIKVITPLTRTFLGFKDFTVHGGFGEPIREASERNEIQI